MAFHIVTNRCFLACEKVTSVLLEELAPEIQRKTLPKKKPKNKKFKLEKAKVKEVVVTPAHFAITISYYPLSTVTQGGNGFSGSGSSRADQENSLEIRIATKKEAVELYKEIITEVQEQHPNEAYLDKLVHKLLGSDEYLEVRDVNG